MRLQILFFRKLKEAELRREVESLQTEMLRLMTSRRPGYKAESTFGTFASRELAKMLANKVTRNLMLQHTVTSLSTNYYTFIQIFNLTRPGVEKVKPKVWFKYSL